jgi:hypothetical protein
MMQNGSTPLRLRECPQLTVRVCTTEVPSQGSVKFTGVLIICSSEQRRAVRETAVAFAKDKRDKRVESIMSLKSNTEVAVSQLKVRCQVFVLWSTQCCL